jgi:hypothetical protein
VSHNKLIETSLFPSTFKKISPHLIGAALLVNQLRLDVMTSMELDIPAIGK